MKNVINIFVISVVILGLTACSGAQTLIKKRNLDVQTKMSATVFLEPVSNSKKQIYVNIRNTSDKVLSVESSIKDLLYDKGYTLVQNPEKANFMLQANILKVGKSDLRESSSALGSGYGGALIGAALSGSDASYASSRNVTLIGAAIGFVADAMIDDTFYSMITDIQIRERPLEGESITQQQDTIITQGTGTALTQKIKGVQVKWKTYQSRIVSTANQVNLEFIDAKDKLENGLITSVGGIF